MFKPHEKNNQIQASDILFQTIYGLLESELK